MNTLRAAMVPGLISGIISIFGSWFWMAVVFHRFQKETPDTWRREGPSHYLCASILRLVATFGISCLFILIVRFNVAFFGASLAGRIPFHQPSHAALSDHVHCFDTLQRPPRTLKGSVALGQPNSLFDCSVILFNHVIEILALA